MRRKRLPLHRTPILIRDRSRGTTQEKSRCHHWRTGGRTRSGGLLWLSLRFQVADVHGNLVSTSVPVRLQKVTAYQMNLPVDQTPKDCGEYLDLLHRRGAKVYSNTAMLIVTGDAPQVEQKISGYEFVEPVTYSRVAELVSEADSVIVY